MSKENTKDEEPEPLSSDKTVFDSLHGAYRHRFPSSPFKLPVRKSKPSPKIVSRLNADGYKDIKDLLTELQTSRQGLSRKEATRRLETEGLN